jgi:hypothetical protein
MNPLPGREFKGMSRGTQREFQAKFTPETPAFFVQTSLPEARSDAFLFVAVYGDNGPNQK